jgi:ribonuclease E
MASPDEARVDEARDQSPVSDSPPTSAGAATSSDESTPTAPQRRPRGAASFPGGPPPASAPPTDTPVALPPAPAEPPPPPQFRVTTVETAGASFPGGPPPPAPPFSEDPPVPARAAGTRTESSAPAEANAPAEASAPAEAPERPDSQVGEGGDAAAAGEPATTRTGGRRRRRGGRGRSSGDQAATAGDAGADPAAAGTEVDAGQATDSDSGVEGAAATGLASAPAPEVRDAATPGTGRGEAGAKQSETGAGQGETGIGQDETGAGPGETSAAGAGGSARTRARRRRRAAAKARGRTLTGETDQLAGPGGDAAQPAGSGGAIAQATGAETAPESAGDETTRPTRSGRTGETAAAATLPDPAATTPDDQAEQPQAAPTRTSRSRRRSGAAGNGEAQQARTANGEPQQANGDPPAGAGTRTAERGSGRGRRRGRGGRSAAVVTADAAATAAPDAPAETAAPDAPAETDRAQGKEQGGGRGRSTGSERSTRLETRSRREGARQADRGRKRRPSGLTEEQKRILREEGPDRRMIVTEGAERTQIGVLEGPTLVEHYVTRKSGRSMVGNIYLGRVQNVLPGMEAAFVDIGRGRNAVLYAGEVNYNEEDLDGEAPRIEKVLKAGQPVLVQVTKDPIGAKGARLTAQVSLAGRYLVLQPEDNTFGISRRLPEAERSRLRDILKEVRPKGLGLIVRTAAEGASADDLRADLARLQARWEAVERKAKKSSAPAVIYSEPELVVRVIRDIFSPDFVELVVDGDELHARVEEYLTEVAPDLLPKLHKHQGKLPVFEHYRVVEQIHKALERKVWLPSGGSIVIDRTEAMTVIDVNTGKFVGKANLEETVVANNLEAADEIVRQLRLRDIGGIIIIDFIDMLFERNQQAVVDRLRAALARDKTKSQVMEVSSLGLVQMTRKRVSGGLLDSFSETCPTCDGRGVVITHEIQ